MSIMRRALAPLLTLATSIALAYTLFGLGFVACTTPQATAAIGGTFSDWENSVFPEEDMAAIAEATRAFSIEGAPIDELSDAIRSALENSNPQLAEAFAASGLDIAANQGKAASVAGALSDRYTLPQNALSHLQDCTPIFTTGRISVGVVGGFALVGLIALGFLAGRKGAGRAMQLGAALVAATLLALAAWAITDFDGLFTWMHQMLFSQGNWTFSASSLLIQLFPEAFWAAMAALWVICSLICAALCGLLGKVIAH